MKVVSVDRDKCIGCGLCITACHEGVLELVDGKSFVKNENVCDGLGNCLPVCPADAIRIIDKEAPKNTVSRQIQWPYQIKLVASDSPSYKDVDFLIAADCTAFAYPEFQSTKNGKTLLIGCTKLDACDYSDKLSQIIKDAKSITVMRMEVPCCGGMTSAVKSAVSKSGKQIKINVITISIDGKLLSSETI